MARSNTANQGFSRAGSSTDTFSFTEDHQGLIDKLDAALKYIAALNSAAGNYVISGSNAGRLLDGVPVVGKTAGSDARIVFEDNDGANLTPKYEIGYDDSTDSLWVSPSGSFGAAGPRVESDGTIKLEFDRVELNNKYLNIWPVALQGSGTAWTASSAVAAHFGISGGGSTAMAETPSAIGGVDGSFRTIYAFDTTNWQLATLSDPDDNVPVDYYDLTKGRFVFRTVRNTYPHSAVGSSTVIFNNTGTALTAEFVTFRQGTSPYYNFPGFQLRDAASGAFFDLTAIASSKTIVVVSVFTMVRDGN